MSLIETINKDLKAAMISKDKTALRGIRAIKSALLLAKTEAGDVQISEKKEIEILQKLAKQRKQSIEIYQKQEREDLVTTEKEELEVIEKYLPEQMSKDEIKTIVEQIIYQVSATSIKDMGKVMGIANQKLSGKAPGQVIASVVKEILSQ